MNVLIPKTITSEMFAPGTTIPEVDTEAGEVAWSDDEAYEAKDECTRAGWWYTCVKPVAAGGPAPDSTAGKAYWERNETRPTNRNAPFDEYLYTKARRLGALTLQLDVGFCNGLDLQELEGDLLQITATEGDGPDLIDPIEVPLWEEAIGLWEYLFGELQRATKYSVRGIPIHPAARYTVTISRNDSEVEAAVGYMSVGQWASFNAPGKEVGGTGYGADATPKSYSWQQDRPDGTYIRRAGRKSTNITGTCVIDATEAVRAKAMLDRVLDIPVSVSLSDLPAYSYLSTVGFLTGTVRSKGPTEAVIVFNMKGNI